jgi:hypothetical protein
MDRTYNLNGGFKPAIKRTADLDGPDFFPTPAWATDALIENEMFEGDIWECACGDGSMAERLKRTGNPIISSDFYDRGFGEIGHDFLTSDRTCDNIVTNAPYNSAEGFVARGLRNSRKKLALLLRLAFLEGVNRFHTIFQHTPPSRVLMFSERVTFYTSGVDQKGSGTTAYVWLVWDKAAAPGAPQIKWLTPGRKPRRGSILLP